jgi:hypothetical protein
MGGGLTWENRGRRKIFVAKEKVKEKKLQDEKLRNFCSTKYYSLLLPVTEFFFQEEKFSLQICC